MRHTLNNNLVYFHINPIKQEIFYVGIGDSKRPYETINRNIHWKRTIKKYSYEIIVLHENLTWEGACKLERFYIAQIGRRDKKLGPLVNMTDGGDGFKGTHSDATKLKMSLSHKTRVHPKGYKMSEETKRKIGLANKNIYLTPEYIAKKVEKERKISEEKERKQKEKVRLSEEKKIKILEQKLILKLSRKRKPRTEQHKLNLKTSRENISEEVKRQRRLKRSLACKGVKRGGYKKSNKPKESSTRFIFTDIDDTTFVLPARDRIQIIVF
jgi:hypothetical protein